MPDHLPTEPRMSCPRTCQFAVLFMLVRVLAVSGAPIQWQVTEGGNGHYYDYVQATGLTWHQARNAAAATSFFGAQGHLVTVTSAAEDNFLRQTFTAQVGDPNPPPDRPIIVPGTYAWIGLSDETVEGRYDWVTGELFTYSIWGQGEPSGAPYPDQDYMIVWRRDYGAGPTWSWNDDFEDPTGRGLAGYGSYLIEFDGPFTQAVPEPGTLTLWMFGGAALCIYGIRIRLFNRPLACI